MKRLVCLLAVLMLAAPTFADVTIAVAGDGTVTYVNPEGQPIRAMALDISVSAGQIDGISGYKTDGYSTSGAPGYGIYMTSIDLTVPATPVWGTPVADPAENPHSVGKIPASAITVELGSLYDGVANAPVEAGGTLFQLSVTECCDVTIALNTDIGGIILEDNSSAALSGASGGIDVGPCASEPVCWYYPTQCHGDSASDPAGPYAGAADGLVDTWDWPAFRDAFGKSYPDAAYNPCGDYNGADDGAGGYLGRDGTVDTWDWPAFRDNFGSSVPADCALGGTWPPL